MSFLPVVAGFVGMLFTNMKVSPVPFSGPQCPRTPAIVHVCPSA